MLKKTSNKMGTTTPHWWLGYLINVASIIIGALIVIWQMGRQHRNSLALQKRTMRDQMHLEIYKEIAEKIQVSSYALSNTMSNIVHLPLKFSMQRMIQTTLQLEQKPIEDRAQSIIDLHFNASKSIISLMATMETYEIAIPNFTTFRYYFGEQMQLFNKVFQDFHQEVIQFHPIEVSEDQAQKLGTKVIIRKSPDEEEINKLKTLANKYQEVCIQYQAYITDLRIEAQNNLLGSLFDHKLPPRKPEDPSIIVLTTDKDIIKERPPGRLV
ncbi:MAG: hypothetical protein ACREOW_04245 [Thermodesulfobacteriota bacterium]